MLFKEWNIKDALTIKYEEGVEDGIDIGIMQIAKNMLADGIEPIRVAHITKLPKERVIALKQAS